MSGLEIMGIVFVGVFIAVVGFVVGFREGYAFMLKKLKIMEKLTMDQRTAQVPEDEKSEEQVTQDGSLEAQIDDIMILTDDIDPKKWN